jgi:hypothetical protein
MRAECTYQVMTFRDEREAEEEVNKTRRRQRCDERERERDLENQVRGVARSERREGRVGRRDDRIIVHAATRLVRDVNELEERGDMQEALHASEDMNWTTALSI